MGPIRRVKLYCNLNRGSIIWGIINNIKDLDNQVLTSEK